MGMFSSRLYKYCQVCTQDATLDSKLLNCIVLVHRVYRENYCHFQTRTFNCLQNTKCTQHPLSKESLSLSKDKIYRENTKFVICSAGQSLLKYETQNDVNIFEVNFGQLVKQDCLHKY